MSAPRAIGYTGVADGGEELARLALRTRNAGVQADRPGQQFELGGRNPVARQAVQHCKTAAGFDLAHRGGNHRGGGTKVEIRSLVIEQGFGRIGGAPNGFDQVAAGPVHQSEPPGWVGAQVIHGPGGLRVGVDRVHWRSSCGVGISRHVSDGIPDLRDRADGQRNRAVRHCRYHVQIPRRPNADRRVHLVPLRAVSGHGVPDGAPTAFGVAPAGHAGGARTGSGRVVGAVRLRYPADDDGAGDHDQFPVAAADHRAFDPAAGGACRCPALGRGAGGNAGNADRGASGNGRFPAGRAVWGGVVAVLVGGADHHPEDGGVYRSAPDHHPVVRRDRRRRVDFGRAVRRHLAGLGGIPPDAVDGRAGLGGAVAGGSGASARRGVVAGAVHLSAIDLGERHRISGVCQCAVQLDFAGGGGDRRVRPLHGTPGAGAFPVNSATRPRQDAGAGYAAILGNIGGDRSGCRAGRGAKRNAGRGAGGGAALVRQLPYNRSQTAPGHRRDAILPLDRPAPYDDCGVTAGLFDHTARTHAGPGLVQR